MFRSGKTIDMELEGDMSRTVREKRLTIIPSGPDASSLSPELANLAVRLYGKC